MFPILLDFVVVGWPGPAFRRGGDRDDVGSMGRPSGRIRTGEFGVEHKGETIIERMSMGVVRAPALEDSDDSVAVDPVVGALGRKAAAEVGSRETAAFNTDNERPVSLRNESMA